MDTMILNSSAAAEWQALVEEAKTKNSSVLTEEIECYLIFLLMRFANQPEIANSILAMDFLKSLQQIRKERSVSLQNLGDKCLLYAGLFPGRAQRRRVRISYFVRLGQMAYSSLSEEKNASLANLYSNLAEQFVMLMDILHAMREINPQSAALDLLQAEELWSDTKSLHALQTLRKATQGFFPENLLSGQPNLFGLPNQNPQDNLQDYILDYFHSDNNIKKH